MRKNAKQKSKRYKGSNIESHGDKCPRCGWSALNKSGKPVHNVGGHKPIKTKSG